MTKENAQRVFTDYYKDNYWGDNESKSGKGSNIENASYLMERLPWLIERLDITSIVDLPCGDMNFMQHINLGNASYIGCDIVPEIVADNKLRFPDKDFLLMDAQSDPIPTADLVINRDLLIHLPNSAIESVLGNVFNSQSKYLLTSHYLRDFGSISVNQDIAFGEFRAVDLTLAPFNFPAPLLMLPERQSPHKMLALYDLEAIAFRKNFRMGNPTKKEPANENENIVDSYFLNRETGLSSIERISLFNQDLELSAAMITGKPRPSEDIEDAVIYSIHEYSLMGAVFDGSGESWWGKPSERFTAEVGEAKRTLGDIPGYFLSRKLLSLSDPLKIESAFKRASNEYQSFLSSVGLDPEKDKQNFGGCTFAGFIVSEDRKIHGFSLGDALCVARKEDGALVVTNNQLVGLNVDHSSTLTKYQTDLGDVEGMKRFVTEFKPEQRNKLANKKYGFFDGNERVTDFIESVSFDISELDFIVAITDGAFNSLEMNMGKVAQEVAAIIDKEGIEGLLKSQQKSGSPEASVVMLRNKTLTL